MEDRIRHYAKVVKHRKVEIYADGIRATAPRNCIAELPTVKRGEIKGWSVAARRRCREFILKHSIPDCVRFGACLTLPGDGFLPGDVNQFFVDCLHRFEVAFRRQYPAGGFVFRVELQQRQVPHLHGVFWVPPTDDGNDDLVGVRRLWVDTAVAPYTAVRMPRPYLNQFWGHGVKITEINGVDSAIRYLVDDMSKRKQAQLGYKGKQWGVVGRKNFGSWTPDVLEGREAVWMARLMGRLRRYWVDCPKCIFGRKKSKYHIASSGCSYASLITLARLQEWAKNKVQGGFANE